MTSALGEDKSQPHSSENPKSQAPNSFDFAQDQPKQYRNSKIKMTTQNAKFFGKTALSFGGRF
jgi:hypothetical protein